MSGGQQRSAETLDPSFEGPPLNIEHDRKWYRTSGKRTIDATAASALALVLSPLLAITAAAVWLTSRGPAIYRQVRLGLDGDQFTLYKFRTMKPGADVLGFLCPKGDPRVTRLGRILRATSIDELPQLINIIRGDMSFIGPRPVLPSNPKLLAEYSPIEAERFTVRPGITGWAQVHGRNTLSWTERLEYDAWYARNVSLTTDVRCLYRTVLTLTHVDLNHSRTAHILPQAPDRGPDGR